MSQIIVGIASGVVGGLALLLLALVLPRNKCPECGAPLPKIRSPRSLREAFLGGNTCPACGCQMDRKGRKIGQAAAGAPARAMLPLPLVAALLMLGAVIIGAVAVVATQSVGTPKTTLTLEVAVPAQAAADPALLAQTAQILQARAADLGYADASFAPKGDRQIAAQVPTNADMKGLLTQIQRIGLVELVDVGPEAAQAGQVLNTDVQNDYLPRGAGAPHHTILTNTAFQSAQVSKTPTGEYVVEFTLTQQGTQVFADYTAKNIGHYLAIVEDKVVLSSPRIMAPITGGQGEVTGNFTQDEARALTAVLCTKPLTVPIKGSGF